MPDPFAFLGMDFDETHRSQQATLIELSKTTIFTWESALLAASRFSQGRTCSPGTGSKGESKSFPAESQREGSFNICFWIKVEGSNIQWVVRFPKPIARKSLIQMKLRSEVATLQFLHKNTRVPVPEVIGYGLGEDGLPPFVVMTNVDGMRLSLLWMIDLACDTVDSILRSLADIQVELLSHPFNRIGMLDLSTDNDCTSIIPPFSLDELEHCRDGVSPVLSTPFEKVSTYYDYKVDVWTRRVREQRNSVNSHLDAKRKFINGNIVRECINRNGGPRDENGPFYLVHPDLHGKNVIIDPMTWKVKTILDWEGTCILPLQSALNPPKCLCNLSVTDFLLNSKASRLFQDRLRRYAKFLSEVARIDVDPQTQHVFESISPTLFTTWALDDVRDLDQLVWQHIVPSMHAEIQQTYDSILRPDESSDKLIQSTVECRVNEFVDMFYRSGAYGAENAGSWVARKLLDS